MEVEILTEDDAPSRHLRQNLREQIDRSGQSINTVEKGAGIGHGVLSKFLTGAKDSLTLDVTQGLARHFGVTVATLIGEQAEPATAPWRKLRPDPANPRKHFDPEALKALAESIHEQGILQPLVLRPPLVGNPGAAATGDYGFIITAGERRWRAVGLLIEAGRWPEDRGLPYRLASSSEEGARVIALIENLQRENLRPLEEAEAFAYLQKHHKWPCERIAKAIKKTDRYVQLRMKLLDLTPALRQALDRGEGHPEGITLTQARTIARANVGEQAELLRRVLAEEITTEAQIEAAARSLGRAQAAQDAPAQNPGLTPVGSVDGSAGERRSEKRAAKAAAEEDADAPAPAPAAPAAGKPRQVYPSLVNLAPFTLTDRALFERLDAALRPFLDGRPADDTLWLAAAQGQARLQLAPNSQVRGWVVTSYFDREGAWVGSGAVKPKDYARAVDLMLAAGLVLWQPKAEDIPLPDKAPEGSADAEPEEDVGEGGGREEVGGEEAGDSPTLAEIAALKALPLDRLTPTDCRLLVAKAWAFAIAWLRNTHAVGGAADTVDEAGEALVRDFLGSARRLEAEAREAAETDAAPPLAERLANLPDAQKLDIPDFLRRQPDQKPTEA